MLPEEDDGTESSGPPPDPSLREWRHPSEIAAAKAAAARPVTPSSRSILGPLITFGGAAVSVAAIIGLGLYLSSGGFSQQATQQVTIDDPTTPPPATTSLVSRTSQLPNDETTEAGREVVAGGNGDEASDSIDTLDDAPTEDGVNTTTSAAPPPQATTGSVTVSSTTTSVDLLAPERRPAIAPTSDGIYGLVDGEQLERLGGFLVIDGLVFSTGTAIETRTELAIGGESGWATATLIGIDPVTDVAVLAVGDTADGDRAIGEGAAGDAGAIASDADDPDNNAGADTGRSVPANDPMLGRRVEVGGAAGVRPVLGVITAVAQPATVTDGHVVYGALRTSIPRQDDAGGSPLLDSKGGNPIGLVIESNDPLVSAIPLRTLRTIGESFVSVGQPAVEWLGVRGGTHGDGGVVLAEIISGGPAEAAGLLEGDVILTFDNRPVASMNHLAHLIREAGADTPVRLQLRDGEQRRRTVTVTVGTRPPGPSGS